MALYNFRSVPLCPKAPNGAVTQGSSLVKLCRDSCKFMAVPPPYAQGLAGISPGLPDCKNKANQLLRFLIVERTAPTRFHADQSNSGWRIAEGRSCRLSWYEDLLYASSVATKVAIVVSTQFLTRPLSSILSNQRRFKYSTFHFY